MNKKQIGGLILAVVLFIATGVISVLTNVTAQNRLADVAGQILTGGYELDAPAKD